MTPRLDVLISSCGDGILRITPEHFPPVPGVRYVVSWQNFGAAAPKELLGRPDVSLHTLEGRGLSRNRNNCLRHSTAPLILIADDDIIYRPEQLRAVISTFDADRELQLAVFAYEGGDSRKYFPDFSFPLTQKVKNFEPSSIQMALRAPLPQGLCFDERYGLGSGCFNAGEDSLFYHRAKRLGLRGRYFPEVITRHPDESTGYRRITDPRTVHALGAVIARTQPLTSVLRIPLKAWRMSRSGQYPLLTSLYHLSLGAIKAFL